MPRIFISYRREDSAGHAGRLSDHLMDHFGKGQVFMDVDAIEPGLNFVDVVQKAVASCDSLIAVIGREWLTAPDPAGSGGRRLEDSADLVRLEIATALERDIRVIPVLVQGAQMPLATDLPENLKALARRNSLELSDTRFRNDVERLIDAIQAPLPKFPTGRAFVGREREMANQRTALEEALSDLGRLVMLMGEPGIGKTRTIQELALYAQMQGAQVLWGRCYEGEVAPPFGPWGQPIQPYVRQRNLEQLRSEMGSGANDIAEMVSDLQEILRGLEPPAALEPEQAVLDYVETISGESDFLTFGSGEFEHTKTEEEEALHKYRDSDNQLYILGLKGDTIVSTLVFSASHRRRLRHSG